MENDAIESGVTIGEGAILADDAAVANDVEPRDEVFRNSGEGCQEPVTDENNSTTSRFLLLDVGAFLKKHVLVILTSTLFVVVFVLALTFWSEAIRLLSEAMVEEFRLMCTKSPFFAAVILVVLLFSILCFGMIPVRLFVRLRAENPQFKIKEELDAQEDSFIDSPIQETSKDQLARTAFVDALLRRMLLSKKRSCHGAQYMGISGVWGEGKTSVCNLLKEASKSGDGSVLEYVDFNGWECGDDFLRQMFARLLDVVKRERLLKENDGLEDEFAAKIRYWAAISEGDGHWSAFLSGLVGDRWGQVFKASLMSISDLKRDIGELLKKIDKHIVIIIDDVDRMLPKEVFELIRAIRANGDLPNLTYLVLADRDHLSKSLGLALGSNGDDASKIGIDYIQKVFPSFDPLPKVRPSRMHDALYNGIKSVIGDRFKQEDSEFVEESKQILFALSVLRTMRDVKQVINDYDSALNYFSFSAGELKVPNVEFNDLLALVALRHVRPLLYDKLYEWLRADKSENGSLAKNDILKAFVKDPEDGVLIWNFMTACDFYAKGLKPNTNDVVWISQKRVVAHNAQFRLCSETYPWYFTGYSSGVEKFTRSDFESVTDAAKDSSNAVIEAFKGLWTKNRLSVFCFNFPLFAAKLSKVQIDNVLRAIVSYCDGDIDGAEEIGDIYDQLYVLFKRLLIDSSDNETQIDSLLGYAFQEKFKGLWVLTNYLRDVFERDDEFRQYPSGEMADLLVEKLLLILNYYWDPLDYRSHIKRVSILDSWIRIANLSKSFMDGTKNVIGFRQWFERAVESLDACIDVLGAFVHECAYGEASLLVLEALKIKGLVDYQVVVKNLNEVEKIQGLSAAWYAIFERLKYSSNWDEYSKSSVTMENFVNSKPDLKKIVDRRIAEETSTDEELA